MSYFTYDCPNCMNELKGSFGDDVHCDECNSTFETDCDINMDSHYSWIVKQIKND